MSSTTFYHKLSCVYCEEFSKIADDDPNRFEKLYEWTKHLGFKTYKDFVIAEMRRIAEIDKRENEREAKELTSSCPAS